jgi:hypothetical protein
MAQCRHNPTTLVRADHSHAGGLKAPARLGRPHERFSLGASRTADADGRIDPHSDRCRCRK